MNIFKNLLFLQGYLSDPHEVDALDATEAFAPRYGNKVATERWFAPLGHAHERAARPAPRPPVATAGGCG